MRNASLGVIDLPALEFDAGCVLELLAPPLPIVIENVPFSVWEHEQRAWAETEPAALA